jgi:hypothetical protein
MDQAELGGKTTRFRFSLLPLYHKGHICPVLLTMFCLGLPYIMHMVMSVMPIPQSDGIPEARKRWDGIARS